MNRDNGVFYKMLKFVKINSQAQLQDFPELSPGVAEWHFHHLIQNSLVKSVLSTNDRDEDEYIITGLTAAGNNLLLEDLNNGDAYHCKIHCLEPSLGAQSLGEEDEFKGN